MVRFLFTFVGGNGHFQPLIPIARTALEAGHTVAFGAGPGMSKVVEAAGFTVFTLGIGTGGVPERLPLRPLDAAREDREFRDGFARDAARSRIPFIVTLCTTWQPDLLICDETDFGCMLAAERLGLPYAAILVLAAGSFVRATVIGDTLNELRSENGLPPDPKLTMINRYLVLSPFPPSFRDPAYPLPATARSFRSPLPDAPPATTPQWSESLTHAPIVYVTLGTIFNLESGDLFTRVLSGLRELPVNVIMTVGYHIDPAEFGPQPDHIHIERYIPQGMILPYCDLVVSHGGSGSVLGTLAHGLPAVLIPMGADQPLNAIRCTELGVGQMLDPIAATPETVREAASTTLVDPAYRRAAERLRDEIAALPEPREAIHSLEWIATKRRPIDEH